MTTRGIRLVTMVLGAGLLCAPASTAAVEQGALRAGAARVEVTPPVNAAHPPSGKYAHERLFVRAIVLDNGVTRAVLIGADLSGLGEEVFQQASAQIATEFSVPAEQILMSATHSHSAIPAGPPPPGPAVRPTQDVGATVRALMDAVRQATGRLQPAKVGFGAGFSYLNVARDAVSDETHLWTQAGNLDAPSDKTLAVVTITTSDGAPIAAYVNYAMHPINGYLVGITSADFPGAACRYVEQAFGDTMVTIWSQGASGDQNPLLTRPATNALASKSGASITGYELVREAVEGPLREGTVPHGTLDAKVADNLERWIESEGQVLGEEVIRVMTKTLRKTTRDVGIWGARQTLTCPGRTRTNTGREGSAGTYVDGDPVSLRLGVLGIGDTALTSINAEVYSLIGQRVKKQSPVTNTVMVTLANGRANSGYVPNDAAFGSYTFQVLGSRLQPGCAEQGIADGLASMIGRYVAR
jgi:neutral ceramidase